MQPAPNLKDVEAFIASGSRHFRFPPSIERLFDEQRRTYRGKAMGTSILPAIVCYNLFLAVDCYLLPTTAWIAVALHLMVTSWIIVAGLVLTSRPHLIVRELIGVSMPILMIAQILAIYRLNGGDAAAADYQYLAIMIAMYMNVNVRPDFRFALGASLAMGVSYALVLVGGDAALSTKLIGTTTMACTIYLTLTANWRMERDVRHAFVRRLQDRLRRDAAEEEADRDALTGLFNRRHLEEAARGLWASASPASLMAVIMLDVDHFKAFNDRYGHLAGDQCLKRVAGTISSELRDDGDIAIRFGGEEFLILLPGADLATALKTAERIRRSVEACAIPHLAIGANGKVTVSVGAIAGQAGTFALGELIAGSDTALYAAKRNGRNQVWPPFVATGASVSALADARKSVA